MIRQTAGEKSEMDSQKFCVYISTLRRAYVTALMTNNERYTFVGLYVLASTEQRDINRDRNTEGSQYSPGTEEELKVLALGGV